MRTRHKLTLCAHCLSCLICCGLLVDIIFQPILKCVERYVRARQLKYKVQLETILLPTFFLGGLLSLAVSIVLVRCILLYSIELYV